MLAAITSAIAKFSLRAPTRYGRAEMPLVPEALFARTEKSAYTWEESLGLGVTANRWIAQSTPASHRFVPTRAAMP
jgi:hypothetical protein